MMLSCTKNGIEEIWRFFVACLVAFICLCSTGISSASTRQKDFSSADEAVAALVSAARAHDEKKLLQIFGNGGEDLISSGDEVADKDRMDSFIAAYEQKHGLVDESGEKVLLLGENDWPFPIPLVHKNGKWLFDTSKGKEEILNRRVGANELDAIQTMLAIVDAEREYAMQDRNANGLLEYASKFTSDPGKKNGLYWETKEGEAPSPLGELMAEAQAGGYYKKSESAPVPYHGYFYRILTAQGKHAAGGAYNYIVKDNMIGGFAVVAYPAKYGNSGVMTFIVNHDGVVYQKDLGKNTEKLAKAMKRYDPDKTWTSAE